MDGFITLLPYQKEIILFNLPFEQDAVHCLLL